MLKIPYNNTCHVNNGDLERTLSVNIIENNMHKTEDLTCPKIKRKYSQIDRSSEKPLAFIDYLVITIVVLLVITTLAFYGPTFRDCL